MPTILLTGQDERLLKTRADVLRRTGAEVVCVPAEEMAFAIREVHADLVVLCHTTGAVISREVVASAKEHQPGTRVLVVRPNAVGEEDFGQWSVDGMLPSAPVQLVRGVERALAAR